MKPDFSHLPSLQQVIEGIENFHKLNISDTIHNDNYTEVIEKLDKVFKDNNLYFNTFFTYLIEKETPVPFKLFRVREAETVNNLNLICEFSYCPLPLCKPQRANFEQHPVFYASDFMITAIIEVVKNYDISNCNTLGYLG